MNPMTGCATYSTNNMATPVYTLQGADSSKALFWLQDTFMELPSSIPMDLTSFLHLHAVHQWSFEGLITCWHDLLESGCSLTDITLADEYSAAAKERIWQLHQEAGMDEVWTLNAECSKELAEILNDAGKAGNAVDAIEEELYSTLETNEFRTISDPDFYLSLSHTWRWFWTHARNEVDNIDLFTLPSEATFIAAHENTEGGIPLEVIPHSYRTQGPLRDLIIAGDRTALIPGFASEDTDEGEDLPF